MNQQQLQLDVNAIVKFFGGRTECSRLMSRHGYKVTEAAVSKWIERGSIPSKRLMELTAISRGSSRTFDLQNFYVEK